MLSEKQMIVVRSVCTGACLGALLVISGCSLPLVSESEIEAESDGQFQQMRNSMPISTDGEAIRYVNCVARAIVAELDDPYSGKDWEIVVFDDEAVNAFAMPGGKIGVFAGIFKVAENQDQLATVIGHEVAHVTEKHSLERVNREMTTQVGVIGTSAVLGGGQAGYDLVRMGAQVGLSLPYGRGQESEADVVGLEYMADAGFDPRQSVKLWKNMDKQNESSPPEFFSTHPSSDSRIDDLISDLPDALIRYNGAVAAGKQPQCDR
jgi:predicted Zn-dependent protease